MKLSTGTFTAPGLDRDNQIGTGSTDLLLGAFHRGLLSGDNAWQYFSQIMWRQPFLYQSAADPQGFFDGNPGVVQSYFPGAHEASSSRSRPGSAGGDASVLELHVTFVAGARDIRCESYASRCPTSCGPQLPKNSIMAKLCAGPFTNKNSLPPSDFCGQQMVNRAKTAHSTSASCVQFCTYNMEYTIRFAFKGDGDMIAPPRRSYSSQDAPAARCMAAQRHRCGAEALCPTAFQ